MKIHDFLAEHTFKILFCCLILILAIEYKPLEYSLTNLFSFFPKEKIYFFASDGLLCSLIIYSIILYRKKIIEAFLSFSGITLFSFIALTALSIVVAPYPQYGWQYFRFLNLAYIVIFSIILSGSSSEEYKRKIIQTIFIGFVLISVFQSGIAIVQYFSQKPFLMHTLDKQVFVDSDKTCVIVFGPKSFWMIDDLFGWERKTPVFRAYGSLLHPNILGFFLFSCCFASLFFIQKTHKKWMKIFLSFVFFLQSFALILTFSRISILCWLFFISVWIYFLFRYFPYRRSRNHYIVAIFSGTVLLLGTLFYQQLYSRFITNTQQEFNEATVQLNSRSMQYQVALQLIQKRPFLGHGFENYTLALQKYFPKHYKAGLPVVHNMMLILWVEIGLLGLLAFLTYIGYIFYRFFHSPITLTSMTLFTIFSGMLLLSCFDYYFIIFQIGRIYFFMISALILYVTEKQRKPLSLVK